MLPRTSPTKATSGVAIVSASRQSPLEGERPTTGSDEGNSSKGIACTEQPITRAHETWGSSDHSADHLSRHSPSRLGCWVNYFGGSTTYWSYVPIPNPSAGAGLIGLLFPNFMEFSGETLAELVKSPV